MEVEEAKARINSALSIEEWQIRNQYRSVFALLLYWEDGDHKGFQKEAETLGEVFTTEFRFEVGFFAIPTEQSHISLDKRINLLLTEYGKSDNLLIVYYGGHGDPNDEAGEEKLAVWAAKGTDDGPTVDWSIIQPKFGKVQSDVLLLFDCCFAAQAARAPYNHAIPANVELLTACAMGLKTVLPGPHSFTTNLIKQMRSSVEHTGSASVSHLANMLAGRDSGYKYTPVHFSGLGEGKSTICLEPFKDLRVADVRDDQEGAWMTLRVTLRDILTESLIGDIINWLKASPKRKVSRLTVENMVISAKRVHQFVATEGRGLSSAPRFDQLTPSAKHDVLSGWMQFRSLFSSLATKLRDPATGVRAASEEAHGADVSDMVTKDLSKTLVELENSLIFLQSIIQRSILALPDLLNSPKVLTEAIDDTLMQDLEIIPLLQRRLDASFPSSHGNMMKISHGSDASNSLPTVFRRLFRERIDDLGSVLVEYKYYAAPRSVQILEERASLLASLLQSHGPSDFNTLRCLKWFHEPAISRFGLVFEFPDTGGNFRSLRDVIEQNDPRQRPSLGQRFRIARAVGEALWKWHMSANWVHQDIASHNIYFFQLSGSPEFNFANPALCGFEFARPNDKISLNDYLKNPSLDIYRHPSRQGDPDENHTKQHDLYSFGILLLELGIWRLVGSFFEESKRSIPGKQKIRQYIEQIAKRSLAHCMGEAYERATLMCLRSDFGVRYDDAIGSALAKAFHESVLQKLDSGTLLD